MATTVKYNGVEISPTPFVSKSVEPVDYGNRWGYAQNITVRGLMTGAVGTGKINSLTDIFQQGFKNLTIESAGDTGYYSAENCVLTNLSFGDNPFFSSADIGVPYSVTLKSYDVPSGVIDISNEYTYKENPNGTVDITRNISAKGVKVDGTDPIDNAYNFVAMFTGVDPVASAAPLFISGATQSVLLSFSENVNRLNASLSVSETWRYETGSSNPYVTVASLNIAEDVTQDYVALDLDVSFQGNVLNNNFTTVRNAVSGYDPYAKIEDYGVATGQILINSFSIKEDEKANSIDYKVSFLSGESDQALSGIMYHDISMNWDEIKNEKTFNIDSSFKIKGPEEYRESKINEKKEELIADYDHYIAYLYNTIKESEIYNQFETLMGDGHDLNPNPVNFAINQGITRSEFGLSATFNDKDFKAVSTESLPNGKTYPVSIGTSDYTVSISPESWLFELQPASNIEGHFVVQDLQCLSRERMEVTVNNESLGNGLGDMTAMSRTQSVTGASGIATDIVETLSGIIDNEFYLTNNVHNSGEFSDNISKSYILKTGISADFSKNKFYGFLGSGYGRRFAGFKFGY